MQFIWNVKGCDCVLLWIKSGRYYVICHALWLETKQARCVSGCLWMGIVSRGIFGDFPLCSFTRCVLQMVVNWTKQDRPVLRFCSSSRCASVIWALFLVFSVSFVCCSHTMTASCINPLLWTCFKLHFSPLEGRIPSQHSHTHNQDLIHTHTVQQLSCIYIHAFGWCFIQRVKAMLFIWMSSVHTSAQQIWFGSE